MLLGAILVAERVDALKEALEIGQVFHLLDEILEKRAILNVAKHFDGLQ